MRFSHSEDIEAPIDRVFAALSDFDMIERAILRRGVEVARRDGASATGEGLRWDARFRYRGKPRQAEIELVRYEPPTLMVFESGTGGLELRTIVECVALSRSRTRVGLDVAMSPKTLSARLIVQSMKLAKNKIDRKFRSRMSEAATEFERRLKQA